MKRSIFLILPLLALILAACSGTAAQTGKVSVNANASANTGGANSFERSDSQGAVTVTVTPTNGNSPGDTLDFDVSLETHSIDLRMDLASLSTLKTDTGVTVKAQTWEGTKGGHHVKGKLTFPTSQDGKPVLQGAKTVTITIQNVGAAERTFSWEIQK